MSSNPAGRVSREFSAKNAPTSMKTGGRWLVAASPEKKLKNFAIIFGFFCIFILPSVNLCRVPSCHSGNPLPSARHAALGKEAFAVKGYADSSLPSAALGKGFVECKAFFAECKHVSAVVYPGGGLLLGYFFKAQSINTPEVQDWKMSKRWREISLCPQS